MFDPDTGPRSARHRPTPRGLRPITYGTNNEFGFDYLRDNMKFDLAEFVQRATRFAIVDEVDSILIDEARTPLIISGPAESPTDLYEVDRDHPQADARCRHSEATS